MARKGNAPTTQPGRSKNSDGNDGRRTACAPPPNANTARKSKISRPDTVAADDSASFAAPTSLGNDTGAVCGGVGVTSAKYTGRAVRRKQRTGVADGVGIGKAVAPVKPRLRSRTTSCAMAPGSSLGVKADIQGMVDQIKSRNRNNGGGRQAKGGRWTRKRCCWLI